MRPDEQKRFNAVQRSSSLSLVFRGSANCDPVVASRAGEGGCSQLFRSKAMMHENLGSKITSQFQEH